MISTGTRAKGARREGGVEDRGTREEGEEVLSRRPIGTEVLGGIDTEGEV